MAANPQFPQLQGWEATRDALHAYAKVICAVPRALAEPHPKWWHISLKPHPDGAATDPIPLGGEGDTRLQLVLNLRTHSVELLHNAAVERAFTLESAPSAAALAGRLTVEIHGLGGRLELDPDQIEHNAPRTYQMEQAAAYRGALHSTAQALSQLRAQLAGDVGPVQLWPHNFDLAFEWFGTLMVKRNEPDGTGELPAQINFGFAPGDSTYPDPYFYSNPWPFAQELVDHELPSAGRWFTKSWNGSLLPYAAMVGQPIDKLLSYFRAVYDLAAPGLLS